MDLISLILTGAITFGHPPKEHDPLFPRHRPVMEHIAQNSVTSFADIANFAAWEKWPVAAYTTTFAMPLEFAKKRRDNP